MDNSKLPKRDKNDRSIFEHIYGVAKKAAKGAGLNVEGVRKPKPNPKSNPRTTGSYLRNKKNKKADLDNALNY